MTSNSKTASPSSGVVKGFAKNLMLGAISGDKKKQELAEAKKTADRRFNAGIGLTLVSALGGLVYYNNMSAQINERETATQDGHPELANVYDQLQCFCLAVAILALVIAVQRVIRKRQRDFRPNKHVEQISEEEFRNQQKHLTRQEVLKLLSDPKYKELQDNKGKAIEDWNWQVKEASNARKESKNNSPIKGQQSQILLDDNEDSLEKELVKMDEEITQEGGPYLQNGPSSTTSVHKLVKQSSQRVKKTPMTSDTINAKQGAYDDVY